ncbi:MoaD/ThiS family protein, partial [Jatrophihabitans lederbergiae]
MSDLSAPDKQAVSASVVTVRLPAAFHSISGGRKNLPVAGGTVREVLTGLEQQCPGILERLVDRDGGMKRYVNVYRNDIDIRGLDGLETMVAGEDVVWILPAIAGGSGTREPEVAMTDVLPAEYFIDPGPSPHAATAKLRAQCPVHRIDNPPGAEAYAVLGHKVVEDAFGDPRLSKEAENLPARYREKAQAKSLLMVRNLGFADPPEHARLRKPISRAFLPATVAKLTPRIQNIIDDLIDAFPESGEIDLLSDFGLPLPLIVICEYLGIPVEDRPLFQHWSYVLSQDPFQLSDEDLHTASEQFTQYFTDLARNFHAGPVDRRSWGGSLCGFRLCRAGRTVWPRSLGAPVPRAGVFLVVE